MNFQDRNTVVSETSVVLAVSAVHMVRDSYHFEQHLFDLPTDLAKTCNDCSFFGYIQQQKWLKGHHSSQYYQLKFSSDCLQTNGNITTISNSNQYRWTKVLLLSQHNVFNGSKTKCFSLTKHKNMTDKRETLTRPKYYNSTSGSGSISSRQWWYCGYLSLLICSWHYKVVLPRLPLMCLSRINVRT